MTHDPTKLNDCGCCEGRTVQTPAAVENPAGQDAIAYRSGTHSRFKQSMLTRLSDSRHPALRALQTRDDDDFTVALLDAWATVADVLTFYQERIANEQYLRTARERWSLVELARLIGYQLRPGVAADTYLAFTVDEAPGWPSRVIVDVGSRVQSIPGPNEQPQTFETIERMEAQARWNEIRPRLTRPQQITRDSEAVFVAGSNTNVTPGDAILIVSKTKERTVKRVRRVEVDNNADATRIELERIDVEQTPSTQAVPRPSSGRHLRSPKRSLPPSRSSAKRLSCLRVNPIPPRRRSPRICLPRRMPQ